MSRFFSKSEILSRPDDGNMDAGEISQGAGGGGWAVRCCRKRGIFTKVSKSTGRKPKRACQSPGRRREARLKSLERTYGKMRKRALLTMSWKRAWRRGAVQPMNSPRDEVFQAATPRRPRSPATQAGLLRTPRNSAIARRAVAGTPDKDNGR